MIDQGVQGLATAASSSGMNRLRLLAYSDLLQRLANPSLCAVPSKHVEVPLAMVMLGAPPDPSFTVYVSVCLTFHHSLPGPHQGLNTTPPRHHSPPGNLGIQDELIKEMQKYQNLERLSETSHVPFQG